jgi:release factor glutamine methyltransferase
MKNPSPQSLYNIWKKISMHIHTDPRVYGPEDDTYLLLEALEKEELSGDGLEIGTGTGIIALHVCHHFKTFTGIDINPWAVELAKKNAHYNHIDITFFTSDLFSQIYKPYDAIIFNPPYVPADEDITLENLSYHGGEDGRRIIDQFLSQFPAYLNPGGKVYLLQSSLSNIEETLNILTDMKFTATIIARKHLFFEELVVFRIQEESHDQT